MAAFAFGDFELDDAGSTLRLRGEPLLVQPLVLNLLGYLVRHAGRVVPKDELMDALWPGVHVTEASLQRAASLARTALKTGGMEGALRNIPRLGYRFAVDRASLAQPEAMDALSVSGALDQARRAAEARRWAEACARFAEADLTERLAPGDIDLWAYATECQGRLKSSWPLYARAVEGHLHQGARFSAAVSALRLSSIQLDIGHVEASRGWLARAEELLGADGPPDVEAFLFWAKARHLTFDGDSAAALASARRSVDLAEASDSTSMRALAIAYEGFCHITTGDVATGRARQDQAAAVGLSGAVDPLTGSLIYCSILWTCRTFADWSRAAQWTPGFDLWCKMAFAEVNGACRLHTADVLASVGQLKDALLAVDRSIPNLVEEGTWELGDAYRVRGDIYAMMGDPEAAGRDYQLATSLGWDPEPGRAQLLAGAGDVASALAALDRSLARRSWHARQRRGWILANKAQVAARAGRAEVAASALAELDGLGNAVRVSAVQAMVLEARGELASQSGQVGEAIHEIQTARQLWICVQHTFHSARLQLRLADLMAEAGDAAGADFERGAARLAAERIGAGGLLTLRLTSAA